MFKAFPPTILVVAVLALLAGLADIASAQGVYQEFEITSPIVITGVTIIQPYGGDISLGRAICSTIPNCIGVFTGKLMQCRL
jgi:hypothetical protein